MAKWVYQMTPHDQWDYDGINEMILADQTIDGKMRKTLVHFDRNGFGYTLDRANGELLVAEKYDPAVNWATKVDMDKSSKNYGRPEVVAKYAPGSSGEDVNYKGICPAALGTKDEQPAAFSPITRAVLRADQPRLHGLRAVPGEPTPPASPMSARRCRCIRRRARTTWATSSPGTPATGKIVWSDPEQFSVWSGALATAGGVVFYGTLEGYLKAVDAKTGKSCCTSSRPRRASSATSMTYEHDGKQYVAVLSGVGGWAGIGLAAGLTDPTAGLGAVGGYAALANYTALGGTLTVFALHK